ncbi:MAG: hypothetical protein JOZ69_20205, partial [Myxococcales bacterium]|nr:hypothetical protein [Myxococcales bacterium]
AAEVAAIAGGSVSAAVALSDPEESARRDEFVSRLRNALTTRDLSAALALAEDA